MNFVRFKINRQDQGNREARWIFPPGFSLPDGSRCTVSGTIRTGITMRFGDGEDTLVKTNQDGSKKIRIRADRVGPRSLSACHEHPVRTQISDGDPSVLIIEGIDLSVLKTAPRRKTYRRRSSVKSKKMDPSASDRLTAYLNAAQTIEDGIDAGEICVEVLDGKVRFFFAAIDSKRSWSSIPGVD